MRIRPLLLLNVLAALALAPAASAADVGDPFSGQGMWIWQLAKAAGGDPVAIAEQAQAAGIDTVIIKAADGPTAWSQFSPTLVSALKAQGMTVCAYQRLKGRQPTQEAIVAAQAVTVAGADCFVIDAEAELEGRYAQARTYVKALRKRIGPDFPVAYTTFPYLDVHPLEPVSVFLGAGAATVNMPQIYWKDIGNSPAVAWARTVAANRVYQAPLAPIGQLYQRPTRSDVLAFRRLALAYDASGLSWWSWDGAITAGWAALAPIVTATALPVVLPAYPTVKPGARSDLVVWAKDHLRARSYVVTSDTRYDVTTVRAVKAFQTDAGLPVDGIIGPTTWEALLAD
jgi:opacity protein-like surface antigen